MSTNKQEGNKEFGRANDKNENYIMLKNAYAAWREENPESERPTPQRFADIDPFWRKFKVREFAYRYNKAADEVDGDIDFDDIDDHEQPDSKKPRTSSRNKSKENKQGKENKQVMKKPKKASASHHVVDNSSYSFLAYTLHLDPKIKEIVDADFASALESQLKNHFASIMNKDDPNVARKERNGETKLIMWMHLEQGDTVGNWSLNKQGTELTVTINRHPFFWSDIVLNLMVRRTGKIPGGDEYKSSRVSALKQAIEAKDQMMNGEISSRKKTVLIPLDAVVDTNENNVIICVPKFVKDHLPQALIQRGLQDFPEFTVLYMEFLIKDKEEETPPIKRFDINYFDDINDDKDDMSEGRPDDDMDENDNTSYDDPQNNNNGGKGFAFAGGNGGGASSSRTHHSNSSLRRSPRIQEKRQSSTNQQEEQAGGLNGKYKEMYEALLAEVEMVDAKAAKFKAMYEALAADKEEKQVERRDQQVVVYHGESDQGGSSNKKRRYGDTLHSTFQSPGETNQVTPEDELSSGSIDEDLDAL